MALLARQFRDCLRRIVAHRGTVTTQLTIAGRALPGLRVGQRLAPGCERDGGDERGGREREERDLPYLVSGHWGAL